jgi:DNA-binding SARP family transcriptional activator
LSDLALVEGREFFATQERACLVWLAIEEGDLASLAVELDLLIDTPLGEAFEGEQFTAELAIARGTWWIDRPGLSDVVARLRATAGAQESVLQANLTRLFTACVDGSVAVDRALLDLRGSVAPTILASDVLRHVDAVSLDAFEVLVEHAHLHTAKWLGATRRLLSHGESLPVRAIEIIEKFGTVEDISLLRSVGRRHRRSGAALAASRRLAQRTAPPLVIHDLGRMTLTLGGVELAGTSVRRKVLAVLCFLVTQSRMTATRDQVLDAIWPEFDPDTALNSLNQTIYFLRRVIEPRYQSSISPEYIHFEGETLWLDGDLVSSASDECRKLLDRMLGSESDAIGQVLDSYMGRFALDFVYEDWATAYRDTLHAAFLSAVERAITQFEGADRYEEAAVVARRCLEVDPTADQVELRLLRLYRRVGAHSAAAEQYGHYATMLRDELGVEPPDLEDI